jgi:hypothetical protein
MRSTKGSWTLYHLHPLPHQRSRPCPILQNEVSGYWEVRRSEPKLFIREEKAMRTKRGRIKTCLIALAVSIALLGIVSMAEAQYFTTALTYNMDSNIYNTIGQYYCDLAFYEGTQSNSSAADTYAYYAYYYWYYADTYAYDAYVEAYYGYEAIPITIAYYAYEYAYYDYYYRYYAYLYAFYAYEANGNQSPVYGIEAAAYAYYSNYYGSYAAYYEGLCSFGGWA